MSLFSALQNTALDWTELNSIFESLESEDFNMLRGVKLKLIFLEGTFNDKI